MDTDALKETLKRELPGLLREDPEFRAFILDLTRNVYADRDQTESRFDRVLGELQRDREEQSRRWEEQKAERERDREEQARKWAENQAEREQRWKANQAERERDREEQARKWAENQAERERRWEANQAELKRLHEEFMAQAKKHDRSIGALGARWGLQSERAFRDALAGILEESFGVEVLHVNEYDETGEVFGRPDQVELDVIIRNGLLILCELKSSIDKPGMYSFERKARFYERRHGRTADRLIVISPMIDARARKVAERLGIETYGDSIEVPSL